MTKKFILLVLLLSAAPQLLAALPDELLQIQKGWAVANYQTPKNQQEKAFDQLMEKARRLADKYPNRAEPKIWLAIVLSTDAGVTGGFSALKKVKEAKTLLEEAEKIDPKALNGSIYTSLGSLYYQVPGWPLAFGDKKKAEAYLRKALEINPDGIDPNYFYGDFLLSQGRVNEAVRYLQKAKAAPPRPDRPLADKGRRKEAEAKLSKARQQLREASN